MNEIIPLAKGRLAPLIRSLQNVQTAQQAAQAEIYDAASRLQVKCERYKTAVAELRRQVALAKAKYGSAINESAIMAAADAAGSPEIGGLLGEIVANTSA
jgi:hypothetical protein